MQVRIAVMMILALLSANSLQAQTTLRWKLSPGQVFTHTLTQDSKIKINVGGQPIDSGTMMSVENTWTINKVDAGGVTSITQTTPRVKMTMQSPMGGFDVDTASDKEPTDFLGKQMFNSLKTITQSKLTFDMSPIGEISNVQVTKADGQPGGTADAFSQMLGKDGLISMVKQTMHPLPEDALQKGSSWNNKVEMEVPMLGKVAADTKLTYSGTETVGGKTLEKILTDTTTTIGQEGAANPLAKLAIKAQSDKGTLYFDNVSGRFSHADAVQELTLQIAFGNNNIDQAVTTTRTSVLKLKE